MKINFDHVKQPNIENLKPGKGISEKQIRETKSISVSFDGKNRVGFGNVMEPKAAKQMDTLMEQAGNVDVQNMRNQMTVMSHTMSDEDFARMQEEGFDVTEMDPEEAVTILDKIKAELVKSGKHVAGFTDTIDTKTLGEALGSEVLAQSLVSSFTEADIPLTSENIEKTLQAVEIGTSLSAPTEGTLYYMVSNQMDPTVKGFAFANATGANVSKEQMGGYIRESVEGYFTKTGENLTDVADWNQGQTLDDEIDRVLENLGLEGEEGTKDAAKWLIEKGLPVETNIIQSYLGVSGVEFPLTEERIIEAAASAIALGKDPMDGLLQVKERRIFEEIRWSLTAKANLALAESGFSIDTSAMEEVVEGLKQMEEEFAGRLFPQDTQAATKYRMFQNTTEVFKEIPSLPVDIFGTWMDRIQTGTVESFYNEGKTLQTRFEEASKEYETLWTAPRADLGDSIKKAFANVDDILQDLAYEVTSENQKAIRVLGYNHMEMTTENVNKIKDSMEVVERVVERMNPAATLKMIRDGVNPLEKSFTELMEYFDALPVEYTEESRKYSSYLQALEHSHEITPEEKDAFIGVYRLIRQVEKSDGAAIGALVNIGAELHFGNLLSAVRSQKFKTMNVTVDDAIGAVTEKVEKGTSISKQINAAFAKEAREMLQEAAHASKESMELLQRAGTTSTPQTILAAQSMVKEQLKLWDNQIKRRKDEALSLWEELGNKEGFEAAYENLVSLELADIETETFETAETVIEVKELQLGYKQLYIARDLSRQAEFFLPMEIGGELTGVHLQFVNGKGAKGCVRISLESRVLGQVSGEFQIVENKVNGYFVGNQKETVMKLSQGTDIFYKNLGTKWEVGQIDFVVSDLNTIPMDWSKEEETNVSNEGLYDLAKEFLSYVKNLES